MTHSRDHRPAGDDNQRTVAEMLETECARLKVIARASGHDFLAYLLDLAEEEAAARKQDPFRGPDTH